MRVVFMGTPAFAVPALEALIAAGHEVVAAYSQPARPAGRGMHLQASPIQRLAEQHGITVCTPTSLKSPQAQEEFAAFKPDVAVVAAYGLLLPQPILDAPRFGCLNIHPSDLPRWRGAAPIQRTVMAGDASTATCIMRMDAGLDTGPVLLREPYRICPGTTGGQLHDALAARGAALMLQALAMLARGDAHFIPQPEMGVTYAAKITKADRSIDWTRPAEAIVSQIHALSPAPATVVPLENEPCKIYEAAQVQGDATKPPGTVLDAQLSINAGDGQAVRLLQLQWPGKARQPAPDFLRAHPVAPGTLLTARLADN